MNRPSKIIIALPLIVAVALAAGIYLGQQLTPQSTNLLFSDSKLSQNDKLQQVIQYIQSDYVDSIKEQKIVEKTINDILQNLDPHSYYIPKKDYNSMNDPLEGNFEGIGIEFRIQEDTVMVVQPIGGGPSEKVGLRAGDRIIEVEGESIASTDISNSEVIKLLKGPKGTEVNIKVWRPKSEAPIYFTIIRDEIPLYSVDASYLIEEKLAYIKIIRFARTTHDEFIEAIERLQEMGMEKLILDLRNNTGGYMKSAIDLADEFLDTEKLIVFTKGKARDRRDFYASSKGQLENTPVAILINEASASASEILAGALQDNDQGTIIGRRSFGKGLVQEGIQWPDGSAIRLTVARYFTPTGRSIQKPYDEGLKAYNQEAIKRFENGELHSSDSIDFPDSLRYTTPGGKVLYGGGGISPDIFVPIDTSGTSAYYSYLNFQGIFYQFGFQYVDANRKTLKSTYSESSYFKDFEVSQTALKEFYAFAGEKGVDFDETGAESSEELIKNRLKAYIGRNVWGDNIFFRVLNEKDNVVRKAIEVLREEES